jgi:hypothetical protein
MAARNAPWSASTSRVLCGTVAQEPLHDPYPTSDRLVVEVAAQLPVAPTLKHFLDRLRLSVQQRTEPTT